MLPRLNFMPCLVIGALLIAFWAMVYMPDTACFGAAQEKDANDTELGAPTDMSSDEPNSAVETVAETDQNDVTPVQTSKIRNGSKRTPFWKTPKMIATYVVLGIIVIVAAGWFLLRNTGRTRLGMQRTLSSDEDLAGGEFMIVFNWTQKVLYLPTIIASFLAAMLMYLLAPQVAPKFIDQPVFQTTSQSVPQSEPPLDPQAERSLFGFEVSYRTGTMVELIGGLWLAIFFFNLLIEEYNIRLIVIILSLVSFGFLFLLLNLFECLDSFFRIFKHLDMFICWKGYLFAGFIGLLTIIVSWIKGLFYYVVITPNYLNIQEGLTETGKQIARRDFHTSVDTTDLAERLFGFGKVVVTFKQSEKEPIILYVWRIGAKAKKLEEMGTKTIVT